MLRTFFVALVLNARILADGGSVQFQRQAGPFRITLLADHAPVRVGRTDLSILCQRSETGLIVPDANVLIHLRRPGVGDVLTFTLPAKQTESNGSKLYVVHLDLPSSGRWPVRIDVRAAGQEATVTGNLEVQEAQPAALTYWPLFVIVPLMALLFVINRRLRRSRVARS